jgi:LysR family transcriptional regulator, transcriptional activator of nhaA
MVVHPSEKPMGGLNYHHLLYFWTVARTGSIAKASLELGLTQPTISEQLRLLEKSLGHKLFDRAGRSLVLTEQGSTVLEYAKKIFALGEELTAAVSEPRSSAAQKLRIAVTPEVDASMAAQAMRRVGKPKDSLALSVTHDSAERAMPMLRDGKLDLLLSIDPNLLKTFPGAHRHLLFDCATSFVGIHSSNTRFPQSLHDQAILLPAEPIRSQLVRWLKANRIAMHPAGEVGAPDLAVSLAESGLGIAAVPDGAAVRKLKLLGRLDAVRWRLYAFTAEKRPNHSVLAAILASRPRRSR